MKPWVLTEEFSEGKFLVVRRDGTIVEWPHFVLGGKDPCSPKALLAYAREAERVGYDLDYAKGVIEVAKLLGEFRKEHGDGDPDAGPHRTDDPRIIKAMREGAGRNIWDFV